MTAPLLRVRDLRVAFPASGGETLVVDSVDLALDPGESVGLVGESGCGKSVTALALLDLVPGRGRVVEGSSIRLRGEELTGAGARRMREVRGGEIGMVFQEPSTALDPVLTVGRQVAEVVRAHTGLDRRAARERAVALLREVGLPDPVRAAGSHPHELSGGMRQRAVIAAALAGEPSLLVADEPTTALDVTVQAHILELLADLRERRDMALLLVSHDLAVVAGVCDRVITMYAGEVVERACTDELFAGPAHPYTRALVDSRPGAAPGGRLRPVPGTVPPPGAWPEGCRFSGRCPHAWDRCASSHPPLLEVGDDVENGGAGRPAVEGDRMPRVARCWLVEEPARRRTTDG